jgi:hypothetical protein
MDANADERNKIDTPEEHSKDLHANHSERERGRIYLMREERERILTLRATSRSSWAVRVQRRTYIQHSFSPLSLSFGFFHCVVYALCLSSRAHRIELLIVRPMKKSEKSAIWKAKFFFLSQQ